MSGICLHEAAGEPGSHKPTTQLLYDYYSVITATSHSVDKIFTGLIRRRKRSTLQVLLGNSCSQILLWRTNKNMLTARTWAGAPVGFWLWFWFWSSPTNGRDSNKERHVMEAIKTVSRNYGGLQGSNLLVSPQLERNQNQGWIQPRSSWFRVRPEQDRALTGSFQ